MASHPSYHNSYKKEGLIFQHNPPHNKMPNRTIITNIPDLQVCDNSIKTSKYTSLNFLPKNLIVQFSKVANVYFLIIGIMQMIRPISVSGGFPVIFVPLSIVVGVSAIKDFSEDLKRKLSDL
jgi:phospholipid-transporting ATPase